MKRMINYNERMLLKLQTKWSKQNELFQRTNESKEQAESNVIHFIRPKSVRVDGHNDSKDVRKGA